MIMKRMFPVIALLTAGCAGERPQNIGVVEGRLIPCPESPNCVSSFASDEAHAIAPLDANLQAVERVLISLDEANIVNAQTNYLHAEFTSSMMRFVDDVEFLYDPARGLTHVRSASRLGYSDLGANRTRIEAIRNALPSP